MRLNGLTSLRFFAALAVLSYHVFGPDKVPLVDLGYLGVTFFFVLSGFVLMWSGADTHGLLAFYRNRAARILPLHYVTLVVAAMIPFAWNGPLRTLTLNLTLTQAWTSSTAFTFNWVAWSISCEAFFYLVFPITAYGVRRLPTAGVFGVAIGVVAVQALAVHLARVAGHDTSWSYWFPPYRLAEFVVGVCLAEVMIRRVRVPASAIVAGLVVALLGCGWVIGHDLTGGIATDKATLFALPAAVALIYVTAAREIRSVGKSWWLTTTPLLHLGEWSFALYMVHMLVVRAAAACFGRTGIDHFPILAGLAVIMVSLVVSAMACEWVEKPMEKRLRHPRRPSVTALREQVFSASRPT